MPDVDYHGWTHRPASEGGTDPIVGGGGGWVHIERITTDDSGPSDVTFTAIPQIYRHLVILASFANDDTYSDTLIVGWGQGYASYAEGINDLAGYVREIEMSGALNTQIKITDVVPGYATNGTAKNFGALELWFPFYSMDDRSKSVQWRGTHFDAGNTDDAFFNIGGGQGFVTGNPGNDDPIDEIELRLNNGYFVEYCVADLYGIT